LKQVYFSTFTKIIVSNYGFNPQNAFICAKQITYLLKPTPTHLLYTYTNTNANAIPH